MRGLEISKKCFVIDNTSVFLLLTFCCICLKWNCQILKSLFFLVQQHCHSKGHKTWTQRKRKGERTENQSADCKKTGYYRWEGVSLPPEMKSQRMKHREQIHIYSSCILFKPVWRSHSYCLLKNMFLSFSTLHFWDLSSPIIALNNILHL